MVDRRVIWATLMVSCWFTAACDEDNLFRNTTPIIESGSGQVWELALPAFPSAWDFPSGQRFFVGTTQIGSVTGSWALDSRADGTLIFRPFSTLVPELSLIRTGILDLGAVSFESVTEAPDGGYSDVADSTGVPVVQGHVYAFRLTQIGGGLVPVNFAKLLVTRVEQEFPEDQRSRFIEFQWAYQVQPLNRTLRENP